MAAINDLFDKIEDPVLRERIKAEYKKTIDPHKFGLVFEDHLPECTPLHGIEIKIGSIVALKLGNISDRYIVINIRDNSCDCVNVQTKKAETFPLNDLVVVAEFGEPIYPYLERVDNIEHGGGDICHALIQADNYHALQLLEYLYAGKVDCIYIDPPYNTGAKDWKYNNDYVDGGDQYRHSKWLAFMQRRLQLAKKLLNPKDSVLIVTIDEKEYLRLGLLLEQTFPEARIQMVSVNINPGGSQRDRAFARADEYYFFVQFGDSSPVALSLNEEWRTKGAASKQSAYWRTVRRRSVPRSDSPKLFYPVYVEKKSGKILFCGESLPLNVDRNTILPPNDSIEIVWPLNPEGREERWQLSQSTLMERLASGYVRATTRNKFGWVLTTLAAGEISKVLDGTYPIIGRGEVNGEVILADNESFSKLLPSTQWNISSHNAGTFGSQLINSIIGQGKFTFPKSLYAVHDCLKFFVANKPEALIVDFFAGSGTTLHAVNLLNLEDCGRRRCICVTNNEVSNEEAKIFQKAGLRPLDEEWEKYGIARHVTWPRIKCSILGLDVNGNPLKGNYGCNIDSYEEVEADVVDPDTGKKMRGKIYKKTKKQSYPELECIKMSDGFQSNCEFFKLGFLDKDEVALSKQFENLIPVLWMKAGMHGMCPEIKCDELKSYYGFAENHFAILTKPHGKKVMLEDIKKHPEITMVFIITDSTSTYRGIVSDLEGVETHQLYRDYLDNFRINVGR